MDKSCKDLCNQLVCGSFLIFLKKLVLFLGVKIRFMTSMASTVGFKVMVDPSLTFHILLPAYDDSQIHLWWNNFPTRCMILYQTGEHLSGINLGIFFKFLMESLNWFTNQPITSDISDHI